jgi:hypothetical protein
MRFMQSLMQDCFAKYCVSLTEAARVGIPAALAVLRIGPHEPVGFAATREWHGALVWQSKLKWVKPTPCGDFLT